MALFSKRHYNVLAQFFRENSDPRWLQYIPQGAIRRFAAMLARDNPAFNRARFLEACGIEDASE